MVEPSVDVAFPLPTEAPTRIVQKPELAAAKRVQPKAETETSTQSAQTAAPKKLTYGSGEGRQPAPRYPSRALRERQEGPVTVVFTVGENGRVTTAEVTGPCAWPLLNDEASRVIRSRWRFSRGSVRRYQVTINFKIQT